MAVAGDFCRDISWKSDGFAGKRSDEICAAVCWHSGRGGLRADVGRAVCCNEVSWGHQEWSGVRWCRAVLDQACATQSSVHAGYKLMCLVVLSCSQRALLQLFVPLQGCLFHGRVEFNHSVLPVPFWCWPGAVLGWVLDCGTTSLPSAALQCGSAPREPMLRARGAGALLPAQLGAGERHCWPMRATGKCEGEVTHQRPSGCHFSLLWCCAAALAALWLLWPCSLLSSKARSHTKASMSDKVQRVLCDTGLYLVLGAQRAALIPLLGVLQRRICH